MTHDDTPSKPATQSDLGDLRTEMHGMRDALRTEMVGMRGEMGESAARWGSPRRDGGDAQ